MYYLKNPNANEQNFENYRMLDSDLFECEFEDFQQRALTLSFSDHFDPKFDIVILEIKIKNPVVPSTSDLKIYVLD